MTPSPSSAAVAEMKGALRCLLAIVCLIVTFSVQAAPGVRRRAVRAPAPIAPEVLIADDFRFGTRGWEAGFSDYSPIHESIMELDSGMRPLPPELGVSGTGFFITAHNRSDDVFMFLKKKLTSADGIRPDQRYEISFRIRFASNAGGMNCAGIGGHPGFSVFVKAGGSGEEPRSLLMGPGGDQRYQMTVDKGNQSMGGVAASVAGDISTGSDDCGSNAKFVTLERIHRHPFAVTSNSHGELWLLVGTDSGFEGKTRLFYESIAVTLSPRR